MKKIPGAGTKEFSSGGGLERNLYMFRGSGAMLPWENVKYGSLEVVPNDCLKLHENE